MLRTWLMFTLLLLCWYANMPAQALDLLPERAEYRAMYRSGIPISGKAISTLSQVEGQQWKYEFVIDGFLLDVLETVTFEWQPGATIKPHSYYFEQSGWLVSNREARVDFQWDKQRVRNDVEDRPWLMKIPLGTLDKLSYQLQLRMDLAAGKQEVEYRIADGGLLKLYQFKVIGKESVTTRYGTLDALVVERIRPPHSKRKTTLWYAEKLDFALIKLVQTEADGEEYEIELKSMHRQLPPSQEATDPESAP